jgi:hypothetical protein
LAESYAVIASLAPLLLQHQSAGDVHGFTLDRDHHSVDFTMNGYTLHVSLDNSFGGPAESGFGLIMGDGKDAFLGAGKGFRVTFTPRSDNGPRASLRWRKAHSKTASGYPAAASMETKTTRE